MKDSKQGISVILPNYNGRQLLQRNLPSLFMSLEEANVPYEVLVVDDSSSDDSVPMLQAEFPQVRLIANEKNLGFSATCNRGVHAAIYPLLCIVNTDVTFTEDYFKITLPHFTDPALFAVKGAIINYRNNFDDIINTESTSLLYYKRGFLRFNQRVEPNPESFTGNIGGQFVLLGCCFVCDQKKMLELGGFDEIFSPFYWEDADLAIRALRRGYRLAFEPQSKVYHQTSSTIANYRSNTRRRLVSIRNKFLFSWRHLQGTKQWTSHIGFTVLSLLSRWIILDWKYYVAFFNALMRIRHYKVRIT